MNLIEIALTSSLIAGTVSALISYFFSIRLKKIEFRNNYFKEIIERRLDAYNEIDVFVSLLKAVIVDDNTGEAYHFILGQTSQKFIEAQKNLQQSILKSLWIEEKTSSKLEEINYLFFNIILEINNKKDDEVIKVGKKYYKRISDLRFDLENCLREDLFNLHKIDRIFKKKKNNIPKIFEIKKQN